MNSTSRGSLLVAVVALALPLKATGCGRTACITVTSTELTNGACPDPQAAQMRLGQASCLGHTTVEGPGVLSDGLCCYPAAVVDSGFDCGGVGGATSVTGVGFAAATGPGMISGGGGALGAGGSGMPCVRCSQFLAGMDGPICTTSSSDLTSLKTCGCASSCTTVCDPTLCMFDNAPDDACRACLLSSCPGQFQACNDD